jgi:polysaccharide biosynthesis PFTS motif protein
VPPLASIASVARFLAWGLMATGLALFDLLRGRWWHALMLGDAATAALVRMQVQDKLGKEYLYTQSRSCDRPLYTYELEQRGVKNTFYFYSTNSEPLTRPAGRQTQLHNWQAMNWPRYLVWNSYQVEFVRRMVGDSAPISVVGPIWFSTSAIELPVIPERTIAVLDVQPMRMSFYRLLAQEVDYWVPSTCKQFLSDCFHSIRAQGAIMAFKRKRAFNLKYHHPQYVRFVERLSRWENVVAIDPDTSAYKVIEKCSAAISMPFTSTAHIARELGKPACFYDPTGMIQRDDRAAHGIPIIIGRAELQAWLASLELPTPAL